MVLQKPIKEPIGSFTLKKNLECRNRDSKELEKVEGNGIFSRLLKLRIEVEPTIQTTGRQELRMVLGWKALGRLE